MSSVLGTHYELQMKCLVKFAHSNFEIVPTLILKDSLNDKLYG